ncbi:uncharacterized protein LOC106768044 isoform X2 [Vigna radiata var. radiata]|uniref:Uncharacterized protein LOC106768044 isoform X2 n=1 Tax=Vigna radiata var. radiata TaxID=3916 RepID=A0A3Q0F4M9_VIGRR|nr:uncharacterized protein LOC106768044 isoform X2 [Vigna radiata var. radiata]
MLSCLNFCMGINYFLVCAEEFFIAQAVMQIMLWICTRKNNFMTICTNDAITIFLYDFVVKVRSLQADCLSVALQLLLKLKRHLKIMYSLDEAHCQVKLYGASSSLTQHHAQR